MHAFAIGLYLVLCLMLAYVGRRTRIGAFGVFLASVLLTPLLVGFVLALLRPLPKAPSSDQSAKS